MFEIEDQSCRLDHLAKLMRNTTEPPQQITARGNMLAKFGSQQLWDVTNPPSRLIGLRQVSKAPSVGCSRAWTKSGDGLAKRKNRSDKRPTRATGNISSARPC